MDKKSIIWMVLVVSLLGFGVGACLSLFKEKDSTITLDINPGVELTVTNRELVKSVKAFNDDGNAIIDDSLNNKSLKEAIDLLVKNVIDKGYNDGDYIYVLLNVKGKFNSNSVQRTLRLSIQEAGKKSSIIIPLITTEAETKASQYNISEAKAAYILEAIGENDELNFEDLIKKSISELTEMKKTGLYCDDDYILKDNSCKKKLSESEALLDKFCPEGYLEKNKRCYKTEEVKVEKYCEDGQNLENNIKCVGQISSQIIKKCKNGTYNSKSDKCEVLTYDSAGTKKCNGENVKISNNGKCTFGKSTVDGACLGDDTLIDGFCYDMNKKDGDSPVITCPSGTVVANGSNGEACYKMSEEKPVYTCEAGYNLVDNNKCISNRDREPKSKKSCSSGYTLYQDKICLSSKETTDYIDGKTCKGKNETLESDKCIVYETISAKGKGNL